MHVYIMYAFVYISASLIMSVCICLYIPWIYSSICGCRRERGAANRRGGGGLTKLRIRTTRWRTLGYGQRWASEPGPTLSSALHELSATLTSVYITVFTYIQFYSF